MTSRTAWATGVPYAFAVGLSLLIRTEPGSLIAPAFGPWAGIVFGHSCCTMGTFFPLGSIGLVAIGGAVIYLYARFRGGWLTGVVLWELPWLCAALLSVLNSTS